MERLHRLKSAHVFRSLYTAVVLSFFSFLSVISAGARERNKFQLIPSILFFPHLYPQPRPQGAFPWLWNREKRPGDEVALPSVLAVNKSPPVFIFITRARLTLRRKYRVSEQAIPNEMT